MKQSTILLFALLCIGTLSAQENILSLNLKAYTPTSSFNKNIQGTPVGASASYIRTISNSRFSFGVEAGFAQYSSEEVVTKFQERNIRVQAVDGFMTVHGFLRYELMDLEWTKLYGEGKVGTTTFYTDYRLTHCPVAEEMEYEGEFVTHGSAFNLGLGAGVLINPTILFDYNKESDFWIDFSVSSYTGSTSSYQVVKNDELTNNMTTNNKSSITNYLDYKVGFIFKL